MAELEYLEKGQEPAEASEVYDAIQIKLGGVPNIYKLMAYAPKILRSVVDLGEVLEGAKLDSQLRELAYIKSSLVNDCQY
ncbi:MAG: hypothetical protein HY644_14095 [Acidobacteria bacterium]|nr:hypothetical protein [Acidobacteriota bacterium]